MLSAPWPIPSTLKDILVLPTFGAPAARIQRKQRRSKRRRNRAGHTCFRQRALSARGAWRRNRRLWVATATRPASRGLQYSPWLRLERRDPTLAKDLIWVRRGEANKICDILLISKGQLWDKYLQSAKLYLLCPRYWEASMEMLAPQTAFPSLKTF